MASSPRFTSLEDWLDWQSTLHPDPVDLGLERVRTVAAAMGLLQPRALVITVAGTNGKGSVVACLEQIYRAAGYRVASYTSPHLLRYNERIRLDGTPVVDDVICDAFARVDAARAGQTLTYFEFGTLAALDIFARASPDVVLLEVGLGGRLDAVNVIDADIAVVTSIGIDHCAWLGNDRASIGREKAGIFRADRPAVCGDRDPPPTLPDAAAAVGAHWYGIGATFDARRTPAGWSFELGAARYEELPRPALAGDHQLDNAATAVAAVTLAAASHPVTRAAIARGLERVQLAGRCQRVPGTVDYVYDVAHNPASAVVLANFLRAHPVTGRTRAVLAMLDDKDVTSFVAALAPAVDDWYLAGLDGDRGLSADELAQRFPPGTGPLQQAGDVPTALASLAAASEPGDRVLVCGSFRTVAAALASRV